MNNDSKALLDSLLETASNRWKVDGKPMDINLIMENMDKIAFHESKNVTPSFLEGIAESNYDVSSLTPEQQQSIFLGNLLQMPNVEGKMPASFAGIDTDEELADYWAQHHHAGTKVGTDEYKKMIGKFSSDMPYYGGM